MSLAAALSAGGGRPASFLPAIKCSNCGKEIEIASMGEHICRDGPISPRAAPSSLSNPFTLRQMNANGHKAPAMPSPIAYPSQQATPQTRVRAPTIGSGTSQPPPRSMRTAPPRINPDAANRPFLVPQPRSQSPLSPALSTASRGSNTSKPGMTRSMTSPMPRMLDMRPPSPELTGGYDCAFPPFLPPPASVGSRPSTSSGRNTPNSERAPSRGSTRVGRPATSHGDREDMQPPPNPFPARDASSSTVAQRSNTTKSTTSLAAKRKSSRDGREPRFPLQSVRRDEEIPPSPRLPQKGFGAMQAEHLKKAPPQRPARPQEAEVLSAAFKAEISEEPMSAMPSIFSPSQPPVPLRSTDRSRTFPLRQESQDEPSAANSLSRVPSEPALRSGRERRPTLTTGSKTAPSQLPMATLRPGDRTDPRMQNAPPVPAAVAQHRAERSHAPSESSSSAGSTKSSYAHSSTGPSPVESAASSIDTYSPLRTGVSPYGDDEGMRVPSLKVKNPNSERPGMRAEQPARRSPPQTLARPRAVAAEPAPVTPPPAPLGFDMLPESPMDPAMNRRRPSAQSDQPLRAEPTRSMTAPLAPLATHQLSANAMPREYDPYRAPSPLPAPRPRSKSSAGAQRPPPPSTTIPPLPRSRSPAPPNQTFTPTPPMPSFQRSATQPISAPQPTLLHPTPLRRPTTPASAKPTCRGCTLPIEGKSVKAADGRLTGRWHKHCFTCRTCHAPFATADFYVIANEPYCEQHYHEANGSLCSGCAKGIEGQYLEVSSATGLGLGSAGVGGEGQGERKFHPKCFTCVECRVVLAEDYFEIGGRVFCERHALMAMRGQVRVANGPVAAAAASGAGPNSSLAVLGQKELKAERRTTKLMMM
ncbi:hypothetical protein B0A48_04293 [Cryoendolithus antarcticus]|uniref:LIM zinc-binding domain-containing protein n=1 Tax=Cryoendolithus antarcticus TaxID=1507870 RepID=A0A1V8TFA3_9PEZI|nr:hypothetical protein B0A48_04293 [Cryoendolithus antarcticus]